MTAKIEGRTLLLVDEEPTLLDIFHALLQQQGFNVLPAKSSGEAIALCEAHARIDILVSEVVMSGRSGFDLAFRIRDLHPALIVVLISAWPIEVVAEYGDLRSVNGYLGKPFKAKRLLSMISELTPAPSRQEA